jgi:hypothetical protein
MITLILISVAGICNAVMDVLWSRYDVSVFRNLNPMFWNPQVSWKNKWAQPYPQPAPHEWYYFGFYPEYKERFPYSSTIFVFLTDAWHLFKFLMLIFIMLGVVFYTPISGNPWLDAFVLYCIFTVTFTIWYSYVLVE